MYKIKKEMLMGTGFLVIIFAAVISGIYYWKYSSNLLISQIFQESNLTCQETVPAKAVNKYTGETKEFPNSCVFPRGWVKASRVSATSDSKWQTYRNEDYGFEIKVPPDYKGINYEYNGSVDYVGVYLTNSATPDLYIKPKGAADLSIPSGAPVESAFSSISGRAVKVKQWNLDNGKTQIRYVFTDNVENWNSCKNADSPDVSCNRIDLFASSQTVQDKLIEIVANISFFKPKSEKTMSTVYYYADNNVHIYNPATGNETTKFLPELENYATIKKVSDDKLIYFNHDEVALFNLSTGRSDILLEKSTENGNGYIPDAFAVSPDKSQVAVGYRSGSENSLAACEMNNCKGVDAGLVIFDVNSEVTRASLILATQASPVAWIGSNIVLNRWSANGTSPQYFAVGTDGLVNSNFVVPKELQAQAVDANLIRTDFTKAVAIRNYQDRFGKGSYLFVNGKVVFKGNLGSINIIEN